MTATTQQATVTDPALVLEFGYTAELAEPLDVGPGPAGNRMVVAITGGRVDGDRISGDVVGPAGDWLLIGADGWASLDVRGQIRTGDGASIHYRCVGHLEINEAVQGFMAGTSSTGFDDQYARLSYQLETGDPRYAWVNRTLFIGATRLIVHDAGRAVEVRVYRVT